MTIAVTGANGQVGRSLCALLGKRALPLSRQEVDLSSPNSINAILEGQELEAIINAAAYTAVDKAESEEEEATRVNADGPGVLAKFAAQRGIPCIHYSTDYVFNGSGNQPWREDDTPAPLSAYGRSKLKGEEKVIAVGGNYLIFRTSWVYDENGRNFLNTMLRLGVEREELPVVADQHGAPSYAPMLAEMTLKCLEKALAMPQFPSGTYNLCGDGVTTWHGFAEAIFDGAKARGKGIKAKEIRPISTSAYPLPAARPLNSRLSLSKIKNTFSVTIPTWQESLNKCLDNKFKTDVKIAS